MIRSKANKMAMRIRHRFMGVIPEIKISKIEVFRFKSKKMVKCVPVLEGYTLQFI